uniref:Uncharacterized protein n=1 Tax=Moniliophthora roreri TaxID=221103 RepID=A0A0W0EWR9_MONRR
MSATIPISSPSSDVLDNVCANAVSNPASSALGDATNEFLLPKSLLITLFTLLALYYLLPRIFYFIYPFQDPEILLQTARDIDRLIRENTSVSKGSNALQGVAGTLKTRLKKLHSEVVLAKTQQEPPIQSVWAWLMFKWTTVKVLIEFASDEEEEGSGSGFATGIDYWNTMNRVARN